MDGAKAPKKRPPREPVRDRRGPSAVEYCVIVALISVVIISAVSTLGTSIQLPLDALASAIAAPSP